MRRLIGQLSNRQEISNYHIFVTLICRFVKRLNTNHSNVLGKVADYYEGFGHFVAPHQVQVGDGVILEGEHILIATGGKPVIPDFPGNEYCGTSDSFWDLEDIPKRSLVIGGGYIAVEMAGILHALGSQTTLACRRDTPLRNYDPFILDLLMEEMKKHGPEVLPNSVIDRIVKREDGLLDCIFQNGKMVEGVDFVLMAAGRTPLVEGLGLEIPGVKVENGVVVVNEKEETTAPNVYCLGDDIGKVDLTPVAIQAGRRLADRVFGDQPDSIMDYSTIPSVVFAHPPIGTCGLTEPEARKIYGEDIQVYKTTFVNSFYALADAEDKHKTGMKIVCVKSTQKVLGVHLIGDNVDEMLQGFAVAIRMGATKKDLDRTVAIHPTAAEEVVTFAPWGKYD